jgi:hypothetical protein
VRVIVPTELREKVLQKVHGSKARGHWGVLRTAAMVRSKYYWKGWAADVVSAVAKCMACENVTCQWCQLWCHQDVSVGSAVRI